MEILFPISYTVSAVRRQLDRYKETGWKKFYLIFGSLIHFNTDGLDFVMTAMFIVIFMEQWLKEKQHVSALVGIGLSLLCLLVFGSEKFIIPAMVMFLAVLTGMRGNRY